MHHLFRGLALGVLAAVLVLGLSTAHAAQKVALVIGNASYTELSSLNNTTNDARAMAEALAEIGFDTQVVLDATDADLRKSIRRFTLDSAEAEIGVVFYAGHGVQVEGANYILPTDFELPRAESDIKISGMKVDDILAAMRSRTRVVLLDACRDNPGFGKRLANAARGVGDQGLAPIKAADISGEAGVFIAFATAAGKVAQDGEGGHSPFTRALLDNIKNPVSIDDMFSMVTKQVSTATKNAQRPYKYASLDSIVCLTGTCGGGAADQADSQVAALSGVAPGVVRSLAPGMIDPRDTAWMLVAWNNNSKLYIAPKSVQRIKDRVTVRERTVQEDGSVAEGQAAFNCKTKTARVYAGVTLRNGKKVPATEFLFAPDVIELLPVQADSFFDVIRGFVCNPAYLEAEVAGDVVFSDQWEPATLDAYGVKWSILSGSIKKAGKDVIFIAKQEIPDTAPKLPPGQITSIDVALTNLYSVVAMKAAVNCDAGELRVIWMEAWTHEKTMTGKVSPEAGMLPFKILANKVTTDIGHNICTKAGKKLVIQ